MKAQENIATYNAVPQYVDKAGWRQATLGEFVASRTSGIVPNKTPDTTFELYSVPSLDTGAPEIISGGEIGSNKQIVDEGTVLLCKINPRINRTWVVSSHTAHQKIASTEWITFPPNDAFEPKYLAYYLKQNVVRDFLAANASGVGGSLMRVKPATLSDFPFPLAPLDQQKSIVAEIEKQFSRLDEAVANLKRVKANLKRYKAAVLKAAVEGHLVETEAERARREGRSYETGAQLLQRILETRRSQWQGKGKYKEPAAPDTTGLPELPEGWAWASVEQLAFVNIGYAFKSNEFAPEGIRLLRGENIEPGRLRWDDTRYWPEAKLDDYRSLLVQEGEIILAMDRPMVTAGLKLARASHGDLPCLLVQRMARMRCIKREMEGYLYVAMQTHRFERHLLGGQTGTQLPHISGSGIASFGVPLPPEPEQHRIVAEVEKYLSLVDGAAAQVTANLKRAEILRQSVLHHAFYMGT